MKTYKTIFFDLDGTLIDSEPDVWELYATFAREYGLSIGEDSRRRAERFAHYYFAGFNYKADLERLGGTEAFRHFYLTRVLQEMQCEGDVADAARYIMQRLRETPRRRFIPDGTRETLAELRARGYTLGLVTNRRDDEMQDAYHAHDLDPYFAFVVTSTAALNPKPDRAMFDLALARGACLPAEAMHVGDNFYADVAGAQALGIAPVLLDPKGLFPEATCLVIQRLPQLLAHLP